MSNANDARRAHDLLDQLGSLTVLSKEQDKLLRSFLPELPKQKTLEEICVEVEGLCDLASSSEGFLPIGGMGVRPRLEELHAQIKGLKDAPATVPALPAGMRIAEHEEYGRCVVSPRTHLNDEYMALFSNQKSVTGSAYRWARPDSLTFIDTVPAPAHPEFLETEADYHNAPRGTIVVCGGSPPWHKYDSEWLSTITHGRLIDKRMSGIIRRVLRWGRGNE